MSIVEGGKQVEAQSQPFAPVAIRATQKAEAFETANNVFHQQTLLGQRFVGLLLFSCEGMTLALFVRRTRVLMLVLQPLVAAVNCTDELIFAGQSTV